MNPKIIAWAGAIQSFEGYFAPCLRYPLGTASWRNNNPFNMRYGSYARSLGATSPSPMGYAKFPTYKIGFNGGCQMLVDICSGKLPEYNPNAGLLAFYEVFAPASDGNNPVRYSSYIASKLGVSATEPISTFLS